MGRKDGAGGKVWQATGDRVVEKQRCAFAGAKQNPGDATRGRTGGITPYADSQLKPMLKRQTNIPPRYVLKNKAAQRKIQTTPFIGHGVTAGSSKVVTHTGAAASGKH